MPIVCQWYNRRWTVEDTTPSYPNGVEMDVSQCDTFTPKQYVLYTGPPVGDKAAEKAALPGKGKSDKGKGKPLKGKLGSRAPPRMIDLVQRSSILGSLQYWNDRLNTSDMKYPMVSIHVADFGGHYPEATQWRQTGFLALIQCYAVLPDFPVDIAADMLKLGQTCQGDFPLTDRDLHARLAQENIQNIFFPLAYLTKDAIA